MATVRGLWRPQTLAVFAAIVAVSVGLSASGAAAARLTRHQRAAAGVIGWMLWVVLATVLGIQGDVQWLSDLVAGAVPGLTIGVAASNRDTTGATES